MTQHPDPAYGVAGSEPPLSSPLPDTAPENAETPAGPDVVVRLRTLADELAKTWKDDTAEIVAMRDAATALEYLRKANALHVDEGNTIKQLRADIVRLNAELDAARGKEGR